jgi:hypothetical protein
MGQKGSAPASCACFCGMYRHVYVPETWSSQGGLVSSVGVIPLLRAGMHAQHLYVAEWGFKTGGLPFGHVWSTGVPLDILGIRLHLVGRRRGVNGLHGYDNLSLVATRACYSSAYIALSYSLAHLAVPYGGRQDARLEPKYIHKP